LFTIVVDQCVFGLSVEVSNSLYVYLAGPRRSAREIQILKKCDFLYIFECSGEPLGFVLRIRRLVKVARGDAENTLDQSASSNETGSPSISP
jgi:hypothetical protein